MKRIGVADGMVVIQLEERRFPGVIVPGDSLLSLLEDLEEEAPDGFGTKTVRRWLSAYESVLNSRSMSLPYERDEP